MISKYEAGSQQPADEVEFHRTLQSICSRDDITYLLAALDAPQVFLKGKKTLATAIAMIVMASCVR